jgi:CDP-glycerol glycerophosphotransferase (TagB/SpsB family)
LASAILRIAGWLFSFLPIRAGRIVLASPRSSRLEGNLRYVAAAIETRFPGRRPVILVETYGYGLRAKVGYFLRAIRGMYYLRTSPLVVVDNAWLPVHVAPHRAETTVVQVWHAVSAVKRFGVDTAIPPREPERTFLHRYYDQVIVSSTSIRGTYAAALRTPIERVVALGTPRTDFFFDASAIDHARRRLLDAYPTLAGRRVVLYAPTLRGRGRDKRSVAALDPAILRARLPHGYALVLKTHPNVDSTGVSTDGYDVVLDARDEINDALALADVLVTDYSSAIFEFALLRRPIILLLGDLAEYARDPGVVVDVETGLVGTQVVDTQGVIDALLQDRFDLSGYDAFIEYHVGTCDGHASERFVDRYIATMTQPRPPSS